MSETAWHAMKTDHAQARRYDREHGPRFDGTDLQREPSRAQHVQDTKARTEYADVRVGQTVSASESETAVKTFASAFVNGSAAVHDMGENDVKRVTGWVLQHEGETVDAAVLVWRRSNERWRWLRHANGVQSDAQKVRADLSRTDDLWGVRANARARLTGQGVDDARLKTMNGLDIRTPLVVSPCHSHGATVGTDAVDDDQNSGFGYDHGCEKGGRFGLGTREH